MTVGQTFGVVIGRWRELTYWSNWMDDRLVKAETALEAVRDAAKASTAPEEGASTAMPVKAPGGSTS